MLRQEINLYRHFEPPRTQADLLSWKRYWILNIGVFVFFTVIYIFAYVENIYLKQRLKQAQVALATYQTEFQKLKNTFPQLFFNKDINEAVKSMKNEVAAQQEIIAILSKHAPFSEDLIALSRSIVPNVWLENISIQKNGEDITIKGNTLGSYIDEFLAQINKDQLFSKYNVALSDAKNKSVDAQNVKLSFEIRMVKKHE